MSEVPAVLVDSNTEEFDAGWVFYYQSAHYVVTKHPGDMLVGNAPIFVARNGASPVFISYHRPTSESVEAFVCRGNANAAPNPEVELLGWRVRSRCPQRRQYESALLLAWQPQRKQWMLVCLAPRQECKPKASRRRVS